MSHDLSECSQPVGGFLEPGVGDDFRLTDAQVESFHKDGFLSGVPILSDAQVDRLRAELQGWFNPEHEGRELWYEYHTNESDDPDRVLFHALGAWRIKPGFHDLLWHPAFVHAAEQLLDGPVRFWHDQLFCKPANHGGVVAWHQDYSYWVRTGPMSHLTCWIGLDDADESNGCVHYIPGSHRWDLLPITGLAGDMHAIREVLNDEQWEAFQAPVPAVLKKGECTFHHALTIHGSFENSTDRPRRATVINTIRDGVCSNTDEPLLQGVPVVPNGSKLEGPFFPMLSEKT